MNRRPINRCAERSCPVVGHWPKGERCPLHAADPAPRSASVREALESQIAASAPVDTTTGRNHP